MSAHGWANDPEFVARVQRLRRDFPAFPVGDYFPEVTHSDYVADVVALFRVEQAAPEMLAALRGALGELENYEGDCVAYEAPEGVAELRSVIAAARAAIAKAEGIR